MKTLIAILLITASTSWSFEIVGPKKTNKKICTVETTEVSYELKALGACVETYDDEYEEENYTVLFTQKDSDAIDKLSKKIMAKGWQPGVYPETCPDKPGVSPYVFYPSISECQSDDLKRAGGCYELEVMPGFDRPDSYYLPEHLPVNGRFKRDIKVIIKEIKIAKVCK